MAAAQALNIPFNLMSASDPAAHCRAFADENLTNHQATHWFAGIKQQAEGTACLRHPYAERCQGSPVQADVALLGSPCHPFSSQRSTRWTKGSVEGHPEFDISMSQSLTWIKAFLPGVLIYEQVMGFTQPFYEKGSETPLLRLRGCMCGCVLLRTVTPPKKPMTHRSFAPHCQPRFKQLLLSQRDIQPGYWLVTLKLDMKIWLPIARPRPAGIALLDS